MAKYVLSEVKKEIAAEHPDIEIELPDGVIVTALPPERWSDDVLELATTDPVAAARAIMPDDYDAFRAAGGQAPELMRIMQIEAGIDVGKESG